VPERQLLFNPTLVGVDGFAADTKPPGDLGAAISLSD